MTCDSVEANELTDGMDAGDEERTYLCHAMPSLDLVLMDVILSLSQECLP